MNDLLRTVCTGPSKIGHLLCLPLLVELATTRGSDHEGHTDATNCTCSYYVVGGESLLMKTFGQEMR